ncbi:Protein NipSnap 3B [Liparis tanakae]|uniref:Protein NipSnap 3B n=1 Tax=Liparis tanakae TaxID=230148 RepID=A0A4Z2FQF2_9TELE|nr:Protein NipSnap 3B [Liparis tanakae]
MLKFRSCSLRSAAALRPPAQPPRVRLSTGPQQEHRTFYEFRTYSIRPDRTAAFLQLTNEKIHLRTAHSELIGYWSVEFGGLNQVFHIWKYDSYSQRACVRAALAQDPSWISEYISKAIPMLRSQESEVAYLVPWSRLQEPPQEGGVYELASFQMRPGGPAVWGDAFQAAVTSHDAPGHGTLLGAFHTECGRLNRVRNCVVHLDSQQNQLLLPCAFSPLK